MKNDNALTGTQRPPGLEPSNPIRPLTTARNKDEVSQAHSQTGCDDACLDRGWMPLGRTTGDGDKL